MGKARMSAPHDAGTPVPAPSGAWLAAAALAAALAVGHAGAPQALALDPAKAITQYSQTVWRTDEGLPQNNVHAIARDRKGYLWFGTESGLARYDGVRFVPFLSSNTPGILNNSVWALLADQRGDLWIGTEGGLTRRSAGGFVTYTTQDGLPSTVVHALHQDQAGVLWVGTSAGLARFDGSRFAPAEGAGAPARERIRALGGSGSILWAGTERGLFRFDGAEWRSYTTRDGLAFDVVYAVREDREGRVWIGTYGGGVSLLQNGRFQSFSTAAGLAHRFVYAIFEDRDGNLWFGTEGGLSRWRDGRFETITPRQGLAHDRIWSFHEDGEGALWLGTRGGGGLIRLKDGVFTTYGVPEGMLGANVYGASEAPDGSVWVAMLGAGVARIGPDGLVRNFTDRQGLRGHDRIWTVHVDRRGAVWAGGDQGLFRLDGERFVPHPGIAKVRALLDDRAGALWIGTAGEGLGRLRGVRLEVLKTADGLPSDSPTALYEDRDGALWVGTWGGGVVKLQDGRVRAAYTMKTGLASDSLRAILQDREGDLWFGTMGGLSRLRDGRLASFTMKDGLFADVIFQVFEDGAGDLWLGSARGVFRVRKRDLDARSAGGTAPLAVTTYGTGDGLRVAACTGLGAPAGFRGSDGRLWFTTPLGLSAVDPNRRRTSAWRPPVLVEELLADGAPVEFGDGVELDGGTREVEIRYAALSFRAPERVHFRINLEGFDAGWREVGDRRVAYYTNLSPGAYRFRVAAAPTDGSWAETETVLPFSVRRRFYQTPWFALLGVLVAVGLAFQVHRWRVLQVEAREAALARRVQEALGQIKTLSGLLPICAACKKIRDDRGYWNQIETFIRDHSQADFSHSICPDCVVRLYPEFDPSDVPPGPERKD